MLELIERIGTWLQGIGDSIRDFFIQYGGNPFIWVAIIVGGLVIFELVHQALKGRGE